MYEKQTVPALQHAILKKNLEAFLVIILER